MLCVYKVCSAPVILHIATKVLLLDQAILGELNTHFMKVVLKTFYLYPMYETKIALISISYSLYSQFILISAG